MSVLSMSSSHILTTGGVRWRWRPSKGISCPSLHSVDLRSGRLLPAEAATGHLRSPGAGHFLFSSLLIDPRQMEV